MPEENFREKVENLDALYQAKRKCEHGVMKKASAQQFNLYGLKETLILQKELENGTYKPHKTHPVKVTYPKPRMAAANVFRDRVYQRSLNDQALYPQVSSRFIQSNMACQKGKGTDAALKMFKEYLHDEWLKNGCDINNVLIFKTDVTKYYDNICHDIAESDYKKILDPWTYQKTVDVLRYQYKGDTGYNPGSQMVQITGLLHLDYIDHYVKEILRVQKYIRVMDDIIIVGPTKEYLMDIREKIEKKLSERDLHFNERKTLIVNASKGVMFLGFRFWMNDEGSVIMSPDPDRIHANYRKLARLVKLAKRGIISKEDCDNSLECMIAHLKKGNSEKVIKRLEKFYNILWEDDVHARSTKR